MGMVDMVSDMAMDIMAMDMAMVCMATTMVRGMLMLLLCPLLSMAPLCLCPCRCSSHPGGHLQDLHPHCGDQCCGHQPPRPSGWRRLQVCCWRQRRPEGSCP